MRSPKEKQPRENAKQEAAYEVYKNLATERTLEATAVKCMISPRTAAYWARQFNWFDRAREWDRQVQAKVDAKIGETIADVLARQRKIVRFAIMKALQKVQTGEIKLSGFDLVNMMQHELQLHGWKFNSPLMKSFIDQATHDVLTEVSGDLPRDEMLNILEGEVLAASSVRVESPSVPPAAIVPVAGKAKP